MRADWLRPPLIHGGQNMRSFTCLLVALCISASTSSPLTQTVNSALQESNRSANKERKIQRPMRCI